MSGQAGGVPIVRVVGTARGQREAMPHYLVLANIGKVRVVEATEAGSMRVEITLLTGPTPATQEDLGGLPPEQSPELPPGPDQIILIREEARRFERILARLALQDEPPLSPTTGEEGAGPDKPA
jgi:hypothetical protein